MWLCVHESRFTPKALDPFGARVFGSGEPPDMSVRDLIRSCKWEVYAPNHGATSQVSGLCFAICFPLLRVCFCFCLIQSLTVPPQMAWKDLCRADPPLIHRNPSAAPGLGSKGLCHTPSSSPMLAPFSNCTCLTNASSRPVSLCASLLTHRVLLISCPHSSLSPGCMATESRG